MKEYTLIGLTDLKDVTNLLRLKPLDVPKRDYGTLSRGQVSHSFPETRQRLLPHEKLFGRIVVPAPRRGDPHATRPEPLRFDHGLAIAFLHRER